LKRFCKGKITDVHKLEAVHFAKYNWTVAEEKRLAEEAAKALKEPSEEG